jgi:hypothetical protein
MLSVWHARCMIDIVHAFLFSSMVFIPRFHGSVFPFSVFLR